MQFALANWTNRYWTSLCVASWASSSRQLRHPKAAHLTTLTHHALARRIAAEGMVLLKNNGILPLKDQQHIAVIGRAAKEPYYQGGGSSHINPTQVDMPI